MTDTASETTEAVTGVPFVLNGAALEADEGELLIDAAERHGVHIPRFCYHNRMKPVGMCRMCLVEVDGGRGPSLQPSCMLSVTPDMKVETESEPTKQAQDGVLEFLLANHPLDCPVCDKGGECPLQDNAYAFGPGESRFVEEKRHYEKPIPISDLVQLDRERCILCDRCTRFAADVADDPLIHFIDRGSQTQVNTFPEHPFSSYFSGNTVQICPVGALTASPYRFKARPWDLDAVESTAAVDTTGARIVIQSSQDRLVRSVGVDSDAVNWGWLSDKDRFSYEATNADKRIIDPLVRDGDDLVKTRWANANRAAARALRIDPERVASIGGARLSLESQYAWSKLLKGVLATDHVDAQLGDSLPASLALGLPRATIDQACAPGQVIVLIGPDPKEVAPTLYLRLRHAVVEDGATLIEITPRATSLSKLASLRLRVAPGTVGQVMAAVGDGRLDDDIGSVSSSELATAHGLLTGDRAVTVLFGRANMAESARYVADAIGAVRGLNDSATYLPLLRRGNIHGALEMGLTPGFLPGGARNRGGLVDKWASTPEFEGSETDGILRAVVDGEIDTLILLGADPLADFPDSRLVTDAFDNVKTLIAVESIMSASTLQADIVLPAAMFGEEIGTFCNMEGRLSPMTKRVTAPGRARPDWVIAADLASAIGPDLGYSTLAELRAEMKAAVPALAEIEWDSIDSLADGPLLRPARNWDLDFGEPAAMPSAPQDGFRLIVDQKLWDLGTMTQASPSLRGLAERAALRLSPTDIQLLDMVDADRVVIDDAQLSFDLPFVADPTVAPRTAWIPARLPGFDVRELLSAGRGITMVKLRSADRPGPSTGDPIDEATETVEVVYEESTDE